MRFCGAACPRGSKGVGLGIGPNSRRGQGYYRGADRVQTPARADAQQIREILEIASDEVKAAVTIVHPTDRNFLYPILERLGEPENLDIAHVTIDSRTRKDV